MADALCLFDHFHICGHRRCRGFVTNAAEQRLVAIRNEPVYPVLMRAHLVCNGQKRRDRRLVVVGSLRAGGKVLVDVHNRQEYDRQRHEHAYDP